MVYIILTIQVVDVHLQAHDALGCHNKLADKLVGSEQPPRRRGGQQTSLQNK